MPQTEMTLVLAGFVRKLMGSFLPSRAAAPGASLERDIHTMAEWVSTALKSAGYKADFSPESIREIERFFVEQTHDGEPVKGGLLAEQLGPRLFALGSYCGETLRRELDGQWLVDDDDPQGEVNVAIELESGTIFWPVQRVIKRLDGPEDNLQHWAQHLRGRF
jgi:hypothetical protein